jgi:hypothetical protein
MAAGVVHAHVRSITNLTPGSERKPYVLAATAKQTADITRVTAMITYGFQMPGGGVAPGEGGGSGGAEETAAGPTAGENADARRTFPRANDELPVGQCPPTGLMRCANFCRSVNGCGRDPCLRLLARFPVDDASGVPIVCKGAVCQSCRGDDAGAFGSGGTGGAGGYAPQPSLGPEARTEGQERYDRLVRQHAELLQQQRDLFQARGEGGQGGQDAGQGVQEGQMQVGLDALFTTLIVVRQNT